MDSRVFVSCVSLGAVLSGLGCFRPLPEKIYSYRASEFVLLAYLHEFTAVWALPCTLTVLLVLGNLMLFYAKSHLVYPVGLGWKEILATILTVEWIWWLALYRAQMPHLKRLTSVSCFCEHSRTVNGLDPGAVTNITASPRSNSPSGLVLSVWH